MIKDYEKTLLLGILITILLYIHYNKNTMNEYFTDPIQNQDIPNCYNPIFTKEIDGNIVKHCADINGIMNGCQETDLSKDNADTTLSAFSIFGSYIDGLKQQDVKTCLQRQSKTLSDWGLCNTEVLSKIRGFGYPENDVRLNAIDNACQFYKNASKDSQPKIN